MTVKELYDQIGGNYDEVIGRLFTDELVKRILEKFLDDTMCPDLVAAWERGDEEATFHAAHSAKGVCMNLAFTRLGTLASEITEALRPGNEGARANADVDALVKELAVEYDKVYSAVKEFLGK